MSETNLIETDQKVMWYHEEYVIHVNMEFFEHRKRRGAYINAKSNIHNELNFVGCFDLLCWKRGMDGKVGSQKISKLYKFIKNLNEEEKLLFFGKFMQIYFMFYNRYFDILKTNSIKKIMDMPSDIMTMSQLHYTKLLTVLYRLQHNDPILLDNSYLFTMDMDNDFPNKIPDARVYLRHDNDMHAVKNKIFKKYCGKIMDFVPDIGTNYYKLLAYRYLLQIGVIKDLAKIIGEYLPPIDELHL